MSPEPRIRSRRQAGVGLMEILLVLGLLGFLVAMALAATEWSLPAWRVRAAAGAVAAELRAARQRAMTKRIAVAVDFDAATGRYAMVDDGGGIVRIGHLPSAVTFVHPNGDPTITLEPPGTEDTAALFNPRGQLLSTNLPGHAFFGNEVRGVFMRVEVNVVGVVVVDEWDGSAWQ